MTTLYLRLRSATTFGRGDGVAGWIDREVEQDQDGFPFLRGRTLKGLLCEAAEEVVFAWQQQPEVTVMQEAKAALFGWGGSGLAGAGILHVEAAQLPSNVRVLWRAEMESQRSHQTAPVTLTPTDILESLTGIRRQTAVNEYGAPDHATLRSMRVILRETVLAAELSFTQEPSESEWVLLTAATLGLRAAGTGRNRGRGWCQATLNDEAFMRQHWTALSEEGWHVRV